MMQRLIISQEIPDEALLVEVHHILIVKQGASICVLRRLGMILLMIGVIVVSLRLYRHWAIAYLLSTSHAVAHTTRECRFP